MGKLKEKLLNNLTPEEMDDQFELSAFEYVELVERYKIPQKEDEYVPTDDELEKLEQMVKDYYNSKEFREYVENYNPTDEYVNSLTDEQIDEAIAEHNLDEDELERINDSVQLKYTDSDILYVLDGIVDPQKIDVIKDKLNEVWNTKRGLF
jgi:predicted DNA binding CopG/RHH family protein